MVIGHDHVQAGRGRSVNLLVRRRPAVDGDNQRCAFLRHRVDRPGVETVTLGQPLRDIRKRVQPQRFGRLQQHRGRADPVYVVVAINAHAFAFVHRLRNSRHRQVHLVQQVRVVRRQRPQHELVQLLGRVVPAVMQHLDGQRRKLVDFGKQRGGRARRDVPHRPRETAPGIVARVSHGASLTIRPHPARYAAVVWPALGAAA